MLNQNFADIYEGDDTFHAHAYASAGYPLVILKATEGTTFIDRTHARRSEAAHSAGLPVGHYHFCRPSGGNPKAEMGHFWSTVRPSFRKRTDFLVLDLEEPGTEREAHTYLRIADRHLEHISTLQAVAYSFLSYIKEAGPELQVVSNRWWVAAWGPHVEDIGHGRQIWAQQHTDGTSGPEPHGAAGIGHCDMSTLRPASAQFFHRLRGR